MRPVEDGRYRLVIGGHRLAAVQILGWDDVLCDVRDLDDDEAEDLELRENLDRTDLTKLDQMIFMARRKALDHRLQNRPKHGGDRKSAVSDQRAKIGTLIPRFTEELAEQVGRSERAIQRAIQIVDNLDPEAIRLIRGTKHADNEQSLLKLSQQTPAKQRTLAAQLGSGGAKTIAQAAVLAGFEAAPPEGGDPQGVALAQLHTAWAKADLATRLTFLHDIDAAPAPPYPDGAERADHDEGDGAGLGLTIALARWAQARQGRPLMAAGTVSIDAQIGEVRREIAMRLQGVPRVGRAAGLSPAQSALADQHLAAVLDTLLAVRDRTLPPGRT